MYIYICTCIYVYIYIYAFIHTCVLSPRPAEVRSTLQQSLHHPQAHDLKDLIVHSEPKDFS